MCQTHVLFEREFAICSHYKWTGSVIMKLKKSLTNRFGTHANGKTNKCEDMPMKTVLWLSYVAGNHWLFCAIRQQLPIVNHPLECLNQIVSIRWAFSCAFHSPPTLTYRTERSATSYQSAGCSWKVSVHCENWWLESASERFYWSSDDLIRSAFEYD